MVGPLALDPTPSHPSWPRVCATLHGALRNAGALCKPTLLASTSTKRNQQGRAVLRHAVLTRRTQWPAAAGHQAQPAGPAGDGAQPLAGAGGEVRRYHVVVLRGAALWGSATVGSCTMGTACRRPSNSTASAAVLRCQQFIWQRHGCPRKQAPTLLALPQDALCGLFDFLGGNLPILLR